MRETSFFFLVILCVVAITFGPCHGNSGGVCLGSEKEALLSFKKDLKDLSNRLSSWDAADDDCCKWSGIVCNNSTGHVHELHLRGPDAVYGNPAEVQAYQRSQLGGKLNPSLLNLKHLRYLDLSRNNFGKTPIPSFIGSMVSLHHLNLSESGFEGTIPQQLGNLSSLRSLGLRGPFSYPELDLNVESLQWLSGLSFLEHLDLSYVSLKKALNWLEMINMLPHLKELYLSNCLLDVLHPQLDVNFTSLTVLDLSGNEFVTEIPNWIFTLSSLVSLDLSSSNFQGPIPNGSFNLSSLKTLAISGCYLESPLPSWLFSLTGLVYLDIHDNAFDGPLPVGVTNMTGLRYLDLSECNFNSTIPDWLYGFNRLETLDLHSNELQGEVSSSIGNLTSIVTLDLSYNELEGRLPRQLGNLCHLRMLAMSGNKFEGEVSELFNALSGCSSDSLVNLQFDGNQLSGHLTDELEQIKNLWILYLGGNLISGPIPESLGRLTSLAHLNLAGNQLSGTLPKGLGELSNLEELRISYNLLEGVVSEVHFANLVALRELSASGNKLILDVSANWTPPFRLTSLELRSWRLGPNFPMWLQYHKSIWNLDLSSTGISDEVPTWFWDLSSTTSYLNLSHNEIHGGIPNLPKVDTTGPMVYLGSNQFSGPLPYISSNISELDLSNNSFSGNLSDFVCATRDGVNGLEILHLGENRLSGEIPDCWMNWQSLVVIKLGNNNFTGTIPSSMGLLRRLRSLHLRNNSLSGEVPKSLQNCTDLVMADFGLNQFTGSIPIWIGKSLSKLMVLVLRSNQFSGNVPHEFCNLTSLQILDIADNRLSGRIPRCIREFKAMTVRQNSTNSIFYSFYYGEFLENAFVVTKGREFQYNTILTLVTSIDLSNNNISGEIPEELTKLFGLRSLNLSGNYLTGEIPKKIGDLGSLESLDFSRNNLSGEIPPSISGLTFLNYLNLSYNNLSGRIPLSTQLQSMEASSFIGNHLCGSPLKGNCSIDGVTTNDGNEENDEDSKTEVYLFYLTIVLGFMVGFGGVCGPLLFSRTWRYNYYQFLENISERLCILLRKCFKFFE